MDRVHEENAEAAAALQKYGFCLMQEPPSSWDYDRVDRAVLLERRLALSERTKAAMTPFRSPVSLAPEEGFSSSSDHKDAYHYTALGRPNKAKHLPWGFGPILENWKRVGDNLFREINEEILGHCDVDLLENRRSLVEQNFLDVDEAQEHTFPTDDAYKKYLNAVEDSDHHAISCFRYHASNPSEFHVAAHVDKGVLTICENPNSLEICHKGRWHSLGPQPDGVIAVLVGYSLERATGGIFEAVRHRVRNDGARTSRVTKIRFDPNLVLFPPAIMASAATKIRDMLPEPPDSVSVGDMMVAFNSTHTSVNAATTASRLLTVAPAATNEGHPAMGAMGSFSTLPKDALHGFLKNWLSDLESVFRLSATCKAFRSTLGSEEYLIPLVDRNIRLSWDWALDALGDEMNREVVTPPGSNANNWLAILSKELRKSHKKITITIDDLTKEKGEGETQFKIRPWEPLGKVFRVFAVREGVALSTLRFLLGGERLTEDETPYCLDLQDGDKIFVSMEQVGD